MTFFRCAHGWSGENLSWVAQRIRKQLTSIRLYMLWGDQPDYENDKEEEGDLRCP